MLVQALGIKTQKNFLQQYTNPLKTISRLFFLLLVIIGFSQAAYAQIGQLTVTLTDQLSQQALPNLAVTAYKKLPDGSLKWAKNQTTNLQGQALFSLDGLGSGQVYVLGVKAFNNLRALSKPITNVGNFNFQVGALSATIISGIDNSPLVNYKISAYERLSDGSHKWRAGGNSDNQGVIRFDLAGLGEGRRYFLKAKSPLDGSTKLSQELTKIGKITFTVGNKPLNVTLRDALSKQPLPGMDITVVEQLTDGSHKWRKKSTTDAQGKVVFDLDGLGSGRQYLLKSKVYNELYSYSGLINQTGQFDFSVGTLSVSVLSGIDDSNLPNYRVTAYERLADGTQKWRASGYTDGQGIIRFDLAGLGNGRTYFLKAKSLVDGRTKHSQDLTNTGAVTFTVGNNPLNVVLINDITSQPLVNTDIVVKELLSNGETKWYGHGATDAQGKIAFDLDGLGSGRVYQLRSKPYNAGPVYSPELNTTGDFIFRVGSVPVTLVDERNGLPLAGHQLTAIEKTPDGRLHWKKSGVTDAKGIVNFDLSGLNEGRLYTFKAKNVFNLNKPYFSPWVNQKGALVFAVNPDKDYRLDLKVPTLSIDDPLENALVSDTGFLLRGQANDNVAIEQVIVRIGEASGQATYANGYWQFPVTAAMLPDADNATINVIAYDTAQNQAHASRLVRPITDKEAPALTVTSHQNGDDIAYTGFLISGNVSDNTGISQLTATVNDPATGLIKDVEPVEIAPSGRWTLVVNDVTEGQLITIILTATDSAGNRSAQQLDLNAVSVAKDGIQLINRLTFGATPGLINEVHQIGAAAFINQQLNPASIDDSEFQTAIANWVPGSRRELIDYQLQHAIFSKRQLQEIMTWFWENHFNTDINKTRRIGYELAENTLFRQYALGNFRDLLEISATSPAMMVYLDNRYNRKEEPNENYARELLELHTLGVNGGYTDMDVVEVARVFTGWHVQSGVFFFNAARHDDGEKQILGNTIPSGLGMAGGEMLLDILATHPSTATFICTKLLQVFVNDKPRVAAVENCADSFIASQGNISSVLTTIFNSPDFNDSAHYHQKFKTPLEFLAGIERNLLAQHSYRDTFMALQNMGMPLFHNPVPTGWAETGDEWINANQLLLRLRFGDSLLSNRANQYYTHLTDMTGYFRSQGYETAQGVLGYLFMVALDSDYSELQWQTAYNQLTQNGSVPFSLDSEDAEQALRAVIKTVLSYPTYQLQ